MNCSSCSTPLLPNARFCHNCGKESNGNGIVCLQCNHVNPALARFCSSCGNPVNLQYQRNPNISPLYHLDFSDIPTLPLQLDKAFRLQLSLAIDHENNKEKEALYLHCLDTSNFKQNYLEEATVLMTQEFEEIFAERGGAAFRAIEKEIDRRFNILLERFFVAYCSGIIPHPLSKRILDYQKITVANSNKQKMIGDYLALQEEELTSYLGAIEIPLNKLKNARKIFFTPQNGEVPLFFLDYTLFKSGKEGIVMTNKTIYWKHHFHKNAAVDYKNIERLEFYNDRIEINGIYLNISPTFNYKLYKLLTRLKHA